MFNSPTQCILSEFHLNLIGKKPRNQHLFLGDRQASSPCQEAGPPPLGSSDTARTRQRHHQSHLEGHRVPVSVLVVLLKNDAGRGAWVAQSVNHLPSAQVRTAGSWDRVPHGASAQQGSAFLSPSAPLTCLCSHSLSLK